MAGTDCEIVVLGPDDARAGLALSTEARWNQNEADWRFFLTQGTVFGVRDPDGRLIATGALLPYSAGNAWISMVLVTASWRRRGLATRLLKACLDAAARQGLTTWLDATAEGAAVYGPLGFTSTLQVLRMRLERPAALQLAVPERLSPSDLRDLIDHDHRIMGFDRSALLLELGRRPGSRLATNSETITLVRDGRNNRHIGPLVAGGSAAALALVKEIVESETGPWLLDAFGPHYEFVSGMIGSGWITERTFQRMRFGPTATTSGGLPFAAAGPEYG